MSEARETEAGNQCDGCMMGLPIPENDGIHRRPDGSPFQVCDSDNYNFPELKDAPIEGKGQGFRRIARRK
jgi:hypothetical protein